jgi:hypothetical protein
MQRLSLILFPQALALDLFARSRAMEAVDAQAGAAHVGEDLGLDVEHARAHGQGHGPEVLAAELEPAPAVHRP